MNEGSKLTKEFIERIRKSIRAECSPRHVPSVVLPTKDVPYTINGKKVEIAVKKIIRGNEVLNRDALANPESLDLYRHLPELEKKNES